MKDTPYDVGLQPERTLLAWRRTCLAVSLGGLVLMRFALVEVGAVAVFLGLAAVAVGAAGYVDSGLRYRRAHTSLTSGGELPSPAVPISLLAIATLVLAQLGGVWLVVRAA